MAIDSSTKISFSEITALMTILLCLVIPTGLQAQDSEAVNSDDCSSCHEANADALIFEQEIAASVHEGLECLDCHQNKDSVPHSEINGFNVGCEGCRSCHDDASQEYQSHGRGGRGDCDDMPTCANCHGSHNVLPSSDMNSMVHPANQPDTCGSCHEDLDLTAKYGILVEHPVELFETSVHGHTSGGGVYLGATCTDCHSTSGTVHHIRGAGDPLSSINHFRIPDTCGTCHKAITNDYKEGIHGELVQRGSTKAPVCTDCHGEHGILSPEDPRSPVSKARLAEMTCTPCHESVLLNEKYSRGTRTTTSFIDSYHGLKTAAGDTHVANCASCHGVHRILPSSNPESPVHPDNLQETCGSCHTGINKTLAEVPIHSHLEVEPNPIVPLVEKFYLILIILVIGGMVLHWCLDLFRQLKALLKSRPQVIRARPNEVIQHALLMVTFIVLGITGFALRYDQSWFAKLLFGWERGFELRGVVHRWSAVLFMGTIVWHGLYMLTARGRRFVLDMLPAVSDVSLLINRLLSNLGLAPRKGCQHRFSYVEKAEYWALAWGSIVMVVTGLVLWFDNYFVDHLPKLVMDLAGVVHFWEAWLAALAILVWHMYAVMFNPEVYPMNPSWLTGRMPEKMYEHEFPGDLERAKLETEQYLEEKLDRLEKQRDDDSFGV